MPTPTATAYGPNVHEELARKITRAISPNEIDEILAAVNSLRDEVAQLRRDLTSKSPILTGEVVKREYERLSALSRQRIA